MVPMKGFLAVFWVSVAALSLLAPSVGSDALIDRPQFLPEEMAPALSDEELTAFLSQGPLSQATS